MNGLSEEIRKLWKQSKANFDCFFFGSIDFSKKSYELIDTSEKVWFDLASLTKPLTLSLTALTQPDIFDEKLLLLLNHQSGLPAWGRLSKNNWKEQIFSYPIKKSETLYSDFGALRLMLEIEKVTKKSLKDLCLPFFDKELMFWKDLPPQSLSPVTGFRSGKDIRGVVHDDNAFVLNEFCSHAGLFSTGEGLLKTLININEKCDLLSAMDKKLSQKHDRFVLGFDTPSSMDSLCGEGDLKKCFGHLGFTGTSFWIDCKKKRAQVILTNATKNSWYDREELNTLRKKIGTLFWKE